MTSDRKRRIVEVYDAARARQPHERAAFLDDVCRDDESLRREVMSLLDQPSSPDRFPSQPDGMAMVTPPDQQHSIVGRRLGVYAIQGLLGAGAMGEVYRAHDSKLGRDVAIKILPRALTSDPERLARFEREARVLASLNHPNIATIYGVEDSDGVHAIAMELVEGETLAERLGGSKAHATAGSKSRARALSQADALAIARQIADALDAAHEKGIVHRDLKPANIMLTPQGVVKVLDFGLAKSTGALGTDGGTEDKPASHASTAGITDEGVVLGTAAYMSPEQARGARCDKRTDIWAFGCCLYEMLTGKRAFQGASHADTIARIISEEPDWAALPGDTFPTVRQLLHRCLAKDPRERLRDIGDVRLELAEVAATGSGMAQSALAQRPRMVRHWRLALLAAAVVAGSFLFFAVFDRPDQPPPAAAATPRRTSILIRDANANLEGTTGVVISPDGKTLAFLARSSDGTSHIRVRPLDRDESRALPGTERAAALFFAPDSRSIGFHAIDAREAGTIKRVSLDDGHVQPICETAQFFGGNWGPDNSIVFAGESGLFRVAAGGGSPERLTTVDVDRGEFSHRYPQVLPDGKQVIFTIGTGGDFNSARVAVLDLTSRQHRTIFDRGSAARYLASGHLAYVLDGKLRVVPFDLKMLKITGPDIQLDEPIRTDSLLGSAGYSVSSTGTLVYAPFDADSSQARRAIWVGPDARRQPIGIEGLPLQSPRLSPDGKRLAVVITRGSKNDIWIYNLGQSSPAGYRLTAEGNNINPVWTDDGRWIYFGSDRNGTFNLFRQRSDLGVAEQVLQSRDHQQLPTAWSRDGILVFNRYDPSNNVGIWMLMPGDAHELRAFRDTRFTEGAAAVSPDGRWIAYVSDRTGRYEVYLSAFPDGGSEVPVSSKGGQEPAWSTRGDQIFYRRDESMIAVTVRTTPPVAPISERVLFKGRYSSRHAREYDTAANGSFVVLEEMKDESRPMEVVVVDGWFGELQRALDSGRK